MTVYNKLFTKILDSSIWLESNETRIVWMTLIAAMDEDGFTQFASVKNLAHRARVGLDQAEIAIASLEGPDPDSSDPDNEGRRIERVPGGWMVLNAPKYRDLVTRLVIKEQTRKRVAKHRAAKCNASVTPSNVEKTEGNAPVTQSDTDTKEVKKARKRAPSDCDSEWIEGLKAKDCYKCVNVDFELQKAQTWSENNNRQCTRNFFIRWINRAVGDNRTIAKPVEPPRKQYTLADAYGDDAPPERFR